MFVVNFKLDIKKILITCLIIALIVVTIIEFGTSTRVSSVNAKTNTNYDYVITEDNFVATLKTVHDNIDANLGKTVKLSGFVFRMPDFKDTYFVCGRNVIVNSEDTVAGFLCSYKDAAKFKDNEWVEITGVITKGDYNGTMPVLQVGTIQKITAPANTFVENKTAAQ